MASEIAKRALYGTPKVGGDTLSFCTKCKLELAHVIVSMVDGRPVKVLCKTCRSQHNHRKNPGEMPVRSGGGASAARTPRTRVPISSIRVAELWQKKLAESKAVPYPYQAQTKYKVGDLIEHTKFGMGIVEEVRGLGKMAVLFREGEKVLIHSVGSNDASAS
jgi:hypothetical protein